MGKSFTSLVILALLLVGEPCHAQGSYEISEPRIKLEDSRLLIYYDILHSQASDLFMVKLSVTDESGKEIQARSVTGDIGTNISGGQNRLIIWDFMADQVEVEGDIIVVVLADPVTTSQEETSSDRSFKRGALILQSLVLPGLGMTRFTGDPHWIRGAAGYGCLIGAVVLNKSAINTYEEFLASGGIEEANSLLDQATRQDNISEALAYSAIGIWVVDIVWTLIGTSDLNKQSASRTTRGISLGSDYDPFSKTPLLTFSYKF